MPATISSPPALPAAAAAPSGVTIVDTGPPTPPPAPTTQIKVSQMPITATPAPPPAKGSAMDRLRQDLAKRAKSPGAEPPSSTPGTTAAKPAGETPPDKGTSKGGEPAEPTAAGSPAAPAAPAAADDKTKTGKANPWKLVDQYKTRLAAVEKENADLKTGNLAEQQRKEYQTRIDALSKRAEELENEIKFVDYTKSEEFKKDFVAPYEAAWQRAVSELSEISVTDPATQEVRAAKPEDLLTLVNMPLGQARELADQYFGKFSDDVMAHRKAIRELFDRQKQKLEDVRKTAGEREKALRDQNAAATETLTKSVQENWEKFKTEILKDEKYGKFFTPVEGDEEGNTRLAKGFEFADKAFTENPLDPRLTPEQRATAIKRHVALRNRAAAFGRLVHRIDKLEAEKAALAQELEQYRTTTPGTGGQTPAGQSAATSGKAIDQVFGALRKLAK